MDYHRIPLIPLVRARLFTTTDGRIVLGGSVCAFVVAVCGLVVGLLAFPDAAADEYFKVALASGSMPVALVGTWVYYGGLLRFRASRVLTALLALEATLPFFIGYSLLANGT
jgi:hypothetical protein